MTRDCLHAGVMKIHQLAAALQVLREAITGSIPRGTAAVLLSIMAACCALLADLCVQLRTSEDPRIAPVTRAWWKNWPAWPSANSCM